PCRVKFHHGAKDRREWTFARGCKPSSVPAIRRAGELVPMAMRNHHEVTAAHDHGITLALLVQPGLATSHEVKDGLGNAAGIEAPPTAVGPLLEDPGAKTQASQNVRQRFILRRFGYEIRTI